MGAPWGSHCRGTLFSVLDRCSGLFPSLSDPARRSALCLKVALVVLHLFFAGTIFFFDKDLIQKTKREPWYTASYALLFAATLVQYFVTSRSSPGYVHDAQKAVEEQDALARRISSCSKQQPASSKNGSVIISVDSRSYYHGEDNASAWTKLVMDLYPRGSSTRNLICSYCNVIQPPRAKHCHDCDRCVLQFDHHCVWLGTCVGQGNHCLFWWYICEEAALCLWTCFLYTGYLAFNASKTWLEAVIIIVVLIALSISLIFLLLLLLFHSYLVMTNQTTYEIVRRRRIWYMRGYPERMYPFSDGICRNLWSFCCGASRRGRLDRLPTAAEVEEKFRPFTCLDLLSCRCC